MASLITLGVRGKILNIIKSLYQNLKSRVNSEDNISENFTCNVGVRQRESLSPFLFAVYINDIEETFILKGFEGVDTGKFKLYILLYADDIVLMSETETGLHKGLDIVKDYCWRWKLFVNGNKTKIMIFKKGGINRNVMFKYNDQYLELVNTFSYLGIFSTPGRSLKGYIVKP